MAQVNVAYDDALLTHIDRIAAERGMSRADYLRAVAEESVRAREQGRAMFEPPEPPVHPDAALALASKAEQLCIDLERLARSWDRREKKLIDAFNGAEAENRTAFARLGADLASRFRDGATPFAEAVDELHDDMAQLRIDVLAAAKYPPSLETLRTDIRATKRAALRNRRAIHVHLFDRLSLRGWELGMGLGMALLGLCIVQIMLARVLPFGWIATPVSLGLYGSAETAICELNQHAYRLDHCPKLRRADRAERP